MAIQDAGSNYIAPALDALKVLGATDPILTNFRGSFAFVGYAQANKPTWIAQEQQNRYQGPSIISLRIALTQSQPCKNMFIIRNLGWFSIHCRKTKVIILAYHNRRNQRNQPIPGLEVNRCNCLQARKNTQLVEKVARVC